MDRISIVNLQYRLFAHRRLLAALLTGLAVVAGLKAVSQSPATIAVTVARHDLRSGHIITGADVRSAQVPPAAAPAKALSRDAAIGRRVSAPMRAGESVTDYRAARPGALAGYDGEAVLSTIRVDPADGAASAQVGDRVDVIAVDPDGRSKARIVARNVEIATVPTDRDADTTALSVITTEKNALALATAGLTSRFSIITASR